MRIRVALIGPHTNTKYAVTASSQQPQHLSPLEPGALCATLTRADDQLFEALPN